MSRSRETLPGVSGQPAGRAHAGAAAKVSPEMAPPLRAGSASAQAAALGQLAGSARHSAVLSLQQIQGGRHVQRVLATVQRQIRPPEVPGTHRPPVVPDDPDALLAELQAAATPTLNREVFFRKLAAAPAKARGDSRIADLIQQTFPAKSIELSMAEAARLYGPPPFWPEEERRPGDWTFLDQVEWNLEEPQIVLDERAREGAKAATPLPIPAFFFTGETSELALVIGGVHGDEQSGVEAVFKLRQILSRRVPYFSVVLVPTLFPANVAAGARHSPGKIETNRNFPTPGTSLAAASQKKSWVPRAPGYPVDDKGRKILRENLVLLDLIEKLKPSRIASVHAHSGDVSAGFFAEQHKPADSSDEAKQSAESRSAADRDLVLAMAEAMKKKGKGHLVKGNRLESSRPTGLFHPGPRERGASFGDYMREAVSEGIYEPEPGDRPSITTVTVEVSLPESSAQVARNTKSEAKGAQRAVDIKSYAEVLFDVFLGPPS